METFVLRTYINIFPLRIVELYDSVLYGCIFRFDKGNFGF